ncbi:MAG: hypothetical protein KatS3mg077_3154 [Candidatus Binatia bacterium]|nr:MAG: hypothetical protein KatS3mg077_3154 [Candidatus Binatia bacterium]
MAMWSRAAQLAVVLVAAGFVWLVAAQAKRPSVLLVSLGGVRRDCLLPWNARFPSMGAEPPAPTLAHLCTVGWCFEQAYANAPYPRASAATLLTGGLSAHHGVRGPKDSMAPAALQLGELFSAVGYDTGAVVGSYELASVFGFRGFSRFDDRYDVPVIDHSEDPFPMPALVFHDWRFAYSARQAKLSANGRKRDRFTTDAALGFLATHQKRPFFLWVQYFGAAPLGSSEAPIVWSAQTYADRVRELDRELRRLLEGLVKLGLDQNLWLVVHGESGFALLEHGDYGVAASLYEASVRVPLVVVPPANQRARLGSRRIVTPVSLQQIAPTLVKLLGLPVRVSFPERGFEGFVLQPSTSRHDEMAIALENYGRATLDASRILEVGGRKVRVGQAARGVRRGRWKYLVTQPHSPVDAPPESLPASERGIGAVREELFDLSADPEERHNLAAEKPEVCAELRRYLPPANRGGSS